MENMERDDAQKGASPQNEWHDEARAGQWQLDESESANDPELRLADDEDDANRRLYASESDEDDDENDEDDEDDNDDDDDEGDDDDEPGDWGDIDPQDHPGYPGPPDPMDPSGPGSAV